MVYKYKKSIKSRKSRKSRKKIKTRKKYKGGSTGNPTIESVDDIITLINKKSKGNPLTGSRNFYTFLSRQLYSTHYNVKFLKALQSAYTFSTNGYFVDTILSLCNNDINARNNYYALCILIRLFYSKDIGKSYSYFTLQHNIVENCITMYNITKQKEIINNSIKTKDNNDINLILKNDNFYNILKQIMNNTDPVNKLKSMESSGISYKLYSNIPILNTEFYKNVNIESRKKSLIPINKFNNNQQQLIKDFKQNPEALASIDRVRKEIFKNPIKSAYKSVTDQAAHEGRYIYKSGQDIYRKYLKGEGAGYTDTVTPTPPVTAPPVTTPTETADILKFYQNLIEEKCIIDKNNYSYIILFVLNNILNKIHKLKYIHNDIPFINNDSFCDKFYKILETELLKKDKTICGDEKMINVILS
jgi:hypothetical protein